MQIGFHSPDSDRVQAENRVISLMDPSEGLHVVHSWQRPWYKIIFKKGFEHHKTLCWYYIRDCCCCCLVTKSYLILCNPMDCSPPGFSVHRISQAKILESVAISFSRGSSWPGVRICVFCTGRQILYHWATREAPTLRYGGLLLFHSRRLQSWEEDAGMTAPH